MSHVRVSIVDQVGYITLSRPEKMNGLTLDMLEGLVTAAKSLGDQKDVVAVVIHGEGTCFSSGLDFASVGKDQRRMMLNFIRWPWRSTNLYQGAPWSLRKIPVPVIAAVHGRCYGGALQIALAADIRISSPGCEWSVLEGKWGLIPDMSGAATLSELVGIDVAKKLTMTAEMIDGREAHRIGLVTEVADDPLAAANDLAKRLKEKSPDQLVGAKALFNRTWWKGPRATFKVERAIQLGLLRGANSKIARVAGLKRTVPEFRRRK